VKILVDTHILLWWLQDDPKLSTRGKRELGDGENELYISCVSLWEMSIKRALGKLHVPDILMQVVANNNIGIIPVDVEHVASFANVPPLHSDPFDRMLVAQAITEGLTIMTHDKQITNYSVPCLLV
jgi:PIN domain nuclease of toxin-antitoxin system